jgi:glycosyltransferase involved in cell wall biosynthesis
MHILIISNNLNLYTGGGSSQETITLAKVLSKHNEIDLIDIKSGILLTNSSIKNLTFNYKQSVGKVFSQSKLDSFNRKSNLNFVKLSASLLGIGILKGLYKIKISKIEELRMKIEQADLVVIDGAIISKPLNQLLRNSKRTIIERPVWVGTPWFIPTYEEWLSITHIDTIRFPYRLVNEISSKMITKFQFSNFASTNIVPVSLLDQSKLLKIRQLENIQYIYPTLEKPLSLDDASKDLENHNLPDDFVLFYLSDNVINEMALFFVSAMSKLLKEIKFIIVGMLNFDRFRKFASENVKFLGFLEECAFDYVVSRAKLVIFPIIGSHGIPMRLIKALSMNKPILTTTALTSAFENIEITRSVVVEDDPYRFIELVRIIMEDSTLQIELMKNSSNYFNANLDIRVIEKRWTDYIFSLS